jgi:hypothetical protein
VTACVLGTWVSNVGRPARKGYQSRWALGKLISLMLAWYSPPKNFFRRVDDTEKRRKQRRRLGRTH